MKVQAVIVLIFYAAKIQAGLENCNDIHFNILNDASRNVDNIDGGYCDSLDSPYMSPDWKGPGNMIISFLDPKLTQTFNNKILNLGLKKPITGAIIFPFSPWVLSISL